MDAVQAAETVSRWQAFAMLLHSCFNRRISWPTRTSSSIADTIEHRQNLRSIFRWAIDWSEHMYMSQNKFPDRFRVTGHSEIDPPQEDGQPPTADNRPRITFLVSYHASSYQ